MKMERIMAIFIGFIMVSSMVGFAMISVISTPQQQQGPVIPTIVDRALTAEEKIYILQTGRVLIEDFYTDNCTECPSTTQMLEIFANQFPNHIVLEEAAANQSSLRIIGNQGRITDLEFGLSEDELFEAFCNAAILQPKECLLKDI